VNAEVLVYAAFMPDVSAGYGMFMAACERERPSIWEPPMLDIVFLALTCVLFLIGAGYAVLCDRL
jgi:hypothetical protein